MALVKKNTQQQTQTNNEDVQGYLNIKILDKNGNEHGLSRGIPLSIKRRVDASVLAAVEANPDLELQVVASVHLLNEDQDPIDF